MTNIQKKYSSLLLAFASLFLLSINASNPFESNDSSGNEHSVNPPLGSISDKERIGCMAGYGSLVASGLVKIPEGFFGTIERVGKESANALWIAHFGIQVKKNNQNYCSCGTAVRLAGNMLLKLLKLALLGTLGVAFKLIQAVGFLPRKFFECLNQASYSHYEKYQKQIKIISNLRKEVREFKGSIISKNPFSASNSNAWDSSIGIIV